MKYEQPEHCYPHPPIPTVVEAYENAFPAPQRIAARSSTGLKNMAAFFISRAERTNDVCLCVYEVADILKQAADAGIAATRGQSLEGLCRRLERERNKAESGWSECRDFAQRMVDERDAAREDAKEAKRLLLQHKQLLHEWSKNIVK